MKFQGAIPAVVTVEAYKASRHIVPEDDADDQLIEGLLISAQALVESAANRPLSTRTAIINCRATGFSRWWFPVCPVQTVTAVRWQAAGGTWSDLDVSAAWIECGDDQPQLVIPDGFFAGVTDGAALQITATVGHSADDEEVKRLREAIILVAADWYEAGIDPDRDKQPAVSFGAKALIRQARYLRPAEYGVR